VALTVNFAGTRYIPQSGIRMDIPVLKFNPIFGRILVPDINQRPDDTLPVWNQSLQNNED
jgi:hypothetical protein